MQNVIGKENPGRPVNGMLAILRAGHIDRVACIGDQRESASVSSCWVSALACAIAAMRACRPAAMAYNVGSLTLSGPGHRGGKSARARGSARDPQPEDAE